MSEPLEKLREHARAVASESLSASARARVRRNIERRLTHPRRVAPWIVLALGVSGGAFAAQRSFSGELRGSEALTYDALRPHEASGTSSGEDLESVAAPVDEFATVPVVDTGLRALHDLAHLAPSPTVQRASRPRDDLRTITRAYRDALALRAESPTRALRAFRRLRTRFPDAPLRHEIDLHVLELCQRLSREEELVVEARAFLNRHPDSPRRNAVALLAVQPR